MGTTDGGKTPGKQPSQQSPKGLIYYFLTIFLVTMLLNALVFPNVMEEKVMEVNYNEFLAMVDAGKVVQVEKDTDQIMFLATDAQGKEQIYKTGLWEDEALTNRLYKAGVTFGKVIPHKESALMNFLTTWILPFGLMFLMGHLLSRMMAKRMGGNAMTFGKSNAKIYAENETGKTFADVAGEEEAKEALKEIVDFLHDPKKYADIGATLPKGALLVGPPGTGKTLLAKAVAGEAHVPFFSISGSEFVEMFVGMGAAKVRDLFKQANEKAPCIVFIDEIDTIGKKRDGSGMGGNDEREQTLNQLLTEMDGFDGKKGVVILAATNRPESLDQALLRPGRFDRRIPVELPDLKGREAILKVHGRSVKMDDTVDFNAIARATSGASGAELANIINEAALRAVRLGRRVVCQADLEESVEVVIAGYQKKNKIMTDKEKLIVSYHEVGHALVEEFAVLAALDSGQVAADHLDAVLVERAVLCQLDGGVQTGLAAQRGQQRVRALFLDHALDKLGGDRLNIGAVGQARVGHDGRRIGVDQDDLKAILLEHLAGLGAGVVELAGLANNNGARTNNEDALDVSTFRHVSSPRSQRSRTRRNSSRRGGPSRCRCPGSSPRRP